MKSENLLSLFARVNKGFSLPQAFCTSQEVFDLDLKNIYFKYWLYDAGHTSQIKNPGDYFTYEIGNESILILRDTCPFISRGRFGGRELSPLKHR